MGNRTIRLRQRRQAGPWHFLQVLHSQSLSQFGPLRRSVLVQGRRSLRPSVRWRKQVGALPHMHRTRLCQQAVTWRKSRPRLHGHPANRMKAEAKRRR